MARMGGRTPPAPAPTKPSTTSPKADVPKPAAVPASAAKAAPAAPAAKPAGSFSAAYAKARAMGGSKAQFEFGGKTYQAASTKSEYVPMSQQKKVDIGTATTAKPAASSAPLPPKRPEGLGSTAPTPAAPSGVNTPNVSTPSAKPMTATPDVGRTTPSSGGSSISVAPEKTSTQTPEKKKAPEPVTTMTESFVSVGENKYRIV